MMAAVTASAEVVDGKADAKLSDALHDLKGFLGVDHQEVLGNFEFKLVGLKSAAAQGAIYGRGKILLLELPRRDVDGQRKLNAKLSLHCSNFFAGLKE
jgi:hypothetical protein